MKEFLTHPNNRRLIEQRLHKELVGTPLGFVMEPLFGIPIRFVSYMPERKIREVWHPPKGGRFVEYGPEDEHWMKPLGLGTVEYIDEVPLIVEAEIPMLVRTGWERVTPPSFRSMICNFA